MKFKVSTNEKALETFSGTNYISSSGIYDVKIKFASVDVTKNGAEMVNFNFEYNGNDQVVYGPCVTNTNGDTNEIGAKLINTLAVIVGMNDGDSYALDEETHKVGKDKKSQDFTVITNFSDVDIKVQLQEEYYIPEKGAKAGQIQKRMVIKNFFRKDGASAKEVKTDTDIGSQLKLIEEKYASKDRKSVV